MFRLRKIFQLKDASFGVKKLISLAHGFVFEISKKKKKKKLFLGKPHLSL